MSSPTRGGMVALVTLSHTQVPLGTLDSYVVQGMLRKNELASRQVRDEGWELGEKWGIIEDDGGEEN